MTEGNVNVEAERDPISIIILSILKLQILGVQISTMWWQKLIAFSNDSIAIRVELIQNEQLHPTLPQISSAQR